MTCSGEDHGPSAAMDAHLSEVLGRADQGSARRDVVLPTVWMGNA